MAAITIIIPLSIMKHFFVCQKGVLFFFAAQCQIEKKCLTYENRIWKFLLVSENARPIEQIKSSREVICLQNSNESGKIFLLHIKIQRIINQSFTAIILYSTIQSLFGVIRSRACRDFYLSILFPSLFLIKFGSSPNFKTALLISKIIFPLMFIILPVSYWNSKFHSVQ